MVQTRSQAKAKATNAPTVQSTTRKPVTQSIIPRIDKILIKKTKTLNQTLIPRHNHRTL